MFLPCEEEVVLQQTDQNPVPTDGYSDEQSDQMLVNTALEGVEAAFAELVRRNQLKIRSVTIRFLGPGVVSDEIAQDVFVVAYKNLAKYSGSGSFQSWLVGIAKNHILNHFREKKRKQKIQHLSLSDEIVMNQLEASTVDDEEIQNQQIQLKALSGCLKKLRPEHSSLVRSFYFESIPAEQIAHQQKMKPGTIRMTLMRIRQSLAKCIQKTLSPKNPDNFGDV